MGEEPLETLSEGEQRFEAVRKKTGFIAGPLLFLIVLFSPSSLSVPAHRLAAVLAFVIAFWITEAVPLPVPPALGACLGASFGFMLPVSTPPNAIVYGSGLVPITKMARAGILFDVAGFFLITSGVLLLSSVVR